MAQKSKKIRFPKISKGTPRLKTDINGKFFGGIWGNKYASNKAKAKKELKMKSNLSRNLNPFI